MPAANAVAADPSLRGGDFRLGGRAPLFCRARGRSTLLIAQPVMAMRRALRVPVGLLIGSRFWLAPASQKQLYLGLWEREILGWIRRLSTNARTAIDVGAGEGEYTLFFTRLAVTARIIAVEPDQEALNQLRSNLRLNGIELNGRVEVIAAAAGATDDGMTRRLDSMVARPACPVVMKVDVEGAEVDVLAGARELLRLPDVRIVVETHSAKLESECIARLSSHGFEAVIVRPAWWRALVPERRPLVHNRWLAAWKMPLS